MVSIQREIVVLLVHFRGDFHLCSCIDRLAELDFVGRGRRQGAPVEVAREG